MCRLHYSSSTLTRSFRNCPSAALIDQCENDYCITSRRGLCVRLEIASHTRALYFPTGRERETGPIDNYKPTMGRAGFSVKRHKRTFKCFFFLFFFFGRDKKFFFPKQIPTFLRKMNLLGRTSHLSLFARWLGGFGMQMGMYAQRRKILSSPNFFIARFFFFFFPTLR